MEYAFNVFNKFAADGVTMSASKILSGLPARKRTKTNENEPPMSETNEISELPIVVCVGSDLAIGDSLGPIVGSMLKYKTQGLNAFIYGTLKAPVTAKEISYTRTFLRETHKNRAVIAVDAAVGAEGDVGLIKILDTPLFPGAGANKKLGSIGQASILGVVAEKSLLNYGLLNTTRLNLVYSMAEIISDGLSALLWEIESRTRKRRII
jgi:putative sporulation protein YyaC